jgi:hypothetical protein
LAEGLSGPIGMYAATGATAAAAYFNLPSGDPTCRPPEAACSPVA